MAERLWGGGSLTSIAGRLITACRTLRTMPPKGRRNFQATASMR
jgi:hypothetical protein